MENRDVFFALEELNYHLDETKKEEINNILSARERVSPRLIKEQEIDEVFVFGSNKENLQNARASSVALSFGADINITEGYVENEKGRTYAIPTTSNGKIRSLEEIGKSVKDFIELTKKHPDKKFFVTRIGCGYSQYTDSQVAELFRSALKCKNVYLPQGFLAVLFGEKFNGDNPSELVPSTSGNARDFCNLLNKQLSLYVNWFQENKKYLNSKGNLGNDLSIQDNLERICSLLVMAANFMMKGLPYNAYEQIKEAFIKKVDEQEKEASKNNKKEQEIIKDFLVDVEMNTWFYRMRREPDSWEKKKINAISMFHIPFSLRNIVATQRYSVPGYPCLYLGEHINACWEELGRPNLSDCMISGLQNIKKFKVLDLRIPKEEDWSPDNKRLKQTVLLFPFIIASTFKAYDNKATFKPEYIIPQLLLQYVKEWAYLENKKIKNPLDRVVYGIRYTSVNIHEDTHETNIMGEEQFNNYVIPVIDIKNELCSNLCSLFTITEPLCEEFERINNTTDPTIVKSQNLFMKTEEKIRKQTCNCITSTREYRRDF